MHGTRADFGIAEPVPWFTARTTRVPRLPFDMLAGRPIALSFLGSAVAGSSRRVLADLAAARKLFSGDTAMWLCVSVEPGDVAAAAAHERPPGVQFIWDFERTISAAYGVVPSDVAGEAQYRQVTFVLDPGLRLLAIEPFSPVETHVARVAGVIERYAAEQAVSADAAHAPVLTVPMVFEPAFCTHLVGLFEREGGTDSGFMVEENGLTVRRVNHGFKRRLDVEIGDPALRQAINVRVFRRLVPEVRKAFAFEATHIERHLIACYDAKTSGAETSGRFGPHRDNTTKGTAHRRFAVSIALSEPDYAGGELRFPEYGGRGYRLALGAALVFSCSILHEVRPVTAGRRIMLLPFLYDEAAQRVRDENEHLLREG